MNNAVISLPILNAVNIREIEMLKSILGISYDQKTEELKLTGGFSITQLMQIYTALKDIWKPTYVKMVVEELEQQEPKRTRIHYFGNGRPVALDGYISKMGLLEHEILVEDPLCFPLSVKPTYDGHITKQPELYVKHVFEHAVSMIYLEPWVKKGYVYFVPSLTLIDTEDFWKLAKLNEEIAKKTNFEQQAATIKALRYGIAEGKITSMLEFSRLTQVNYTTNHIKRIFPDITEEEAQKQLEILRNQTLEDREQNVVRWSLEKSQLTEEEKLSLLSYYERTRPFNIERFLDVSGINSGLHASTGMPLLHAAYLAERFHCIPSTDNLGLMYHYEGWSQALRENLDPEFEKVRTKVDLPFTFLDKLPLPFVERAREEGKGRAASLYLDNEWATIRQSRELSSYKKAAEDFSSKVSRDFDQLAAQNQLMWDELVMNGSKSVAKGVGTFVTFNLFTELPFAIIGSLSAIFASSLDTAKIFRRNKNELQVKPLAVFLEAKRITEKRKK
jgi:hypothetical protein